MIESTEFRQVPPRPKGDEGRHDKSKIDEISALDNLGDKVGSFSSPISRADKQSKENQPQGNICNKDLGQFARCAGKLHPKSPFVHLLSFLFFVAFNEVFIHLYQPDNLDYFHTLFSGATLLSFSFLPFGFQKAVSPFSFVVSSGLLLLSLLLPDGDIFSHTDKSAAFLTALILSLAAFAQAFLCLCALSAFCEWVSRPINAFLERRPDMKKPVAFALCAVVVIASLLFIFKEFSR